MSRSFAIGVIIAVLLRSSLGKIETILRDQIKPGYKYETLLALIIRTDLNVGRFHGAVVATGLEGKCITHIRRRNPEMASLWAGEGAPKIVLQPDKKGEEGLWEFLNEAKKNNICTTTVRDPGYFNIDSERILCIGIGPDYKDKVNQIVGHLYRY